MRFHEIWTRSHKISMEILQDMLRSRKIWTKISWDLGEISLDFDGYFVRYAESSQHLYQNLMRFRQDLMRFGCDLMRNQWISLEICWCFTSFGLRPHQIYMWSHKIWMRSRDILMANVWDVLRSQEIGLWTKFRWVLVIFGWYLMRFCWISHEIWSDLMRFGLRSNKIWMISHVILTEISLDFTRYLARYTEM